MKVGLIGLGRMGAAIFRRLKYHDFEVAGWDRNAEAVRALAAEGLRPAPNPRTVAAEADIVISIITEDEGVRKLFLGDEGFFSTRIDGKLFIEMSTLKPATHRQLSPLVRGKCARLIDAPVMGSIPTVREGKLLVLAGGEAADVERATTVLDCLARRVIHMGPAGSGCAMKLAVNLAMALYLQSLAEAIALAEAEGLLLDQILEILSEAPTASPFLKNKTSVLKGEPSDITLDIRTLRKDVLSAIATGAAGGVGMPAACGLAACLSAAIAGGWGEKDLAELPRYFRKSMTQFFP
jgi:3-hydroxyisobutyrate dehydrogenase